MEKLVITEEQWLSICGLLTLAREYTGKISDIYKLIEDRFGENLEGYFCDQAYENGSLSSVRKDWESNRFLNLVIKPTNVENS